MKIIVPMAGMGKRMRPHTLKVPKPLIPVAGKPIVRRLVEDIAAVCEEQFEEIAFIIGPSDVLPLVGSPRVSSTFSTNTVTLDSSESNWPSLTIRLISYSLSTLTSGAINVGFESVVDDNKTPSGAVHL